MSMSSLNSTVTVPLANADRVKAQIEQLAEQLATRAPGYESLLHTIHRNLVEDEATVHLLSDDEIGVIVAALQKKTGVLIAKSSTKEVLAKAKKTGKIDISEL